jgi:hypothetical protein
LIRRSGSFPLTLIGAATAILACTEIPTGADEILSVQFNPLPSPSVVVGDSLRDSLGVVRAPTVTAFNFSGDEVANPPVVFLALDRGIRVDSTTGIVTGDSVRTGARISARVEGLSVSAQIAVTLRPDSIARLNVSDSLLYSLLDTLNVSSAIGVKVFNTTAKVDTAQAVGSYLVSFLVDPADSIVGRLVADAGVTRSTLDTTDASGTASRRVRIDATKLRGQIDSVVVHAFVRYRGAIVGGTPVRLVLKLKPK